MIKHSKLLFPLEVMEDALYVSLIGDVHSSYEEIDNFRQLYLGEPYSSCDTFCFSQGERIYCPEEPTHFFVEDEEHYQLCDKCFERYEYEKRSKRGIIMEDIK